ncbi:hypothetical protein GCM10009099_30850 [Caenispirillum bisanense]
MDWMSWGAAMGALDRINALEDALWQWQRHADKLENQLAAAQAASDRHYGLYSAEFDAHKETRFLLDNAISSAESASRMYGAECNDHEATKALLAQTQAELTSTESRNSALATKLIELMLVAKENKALTARVRELEASLERAENSIDDLGSENAQLHAFLSH